MNPDEVIQQDSENTGTSRIYVNVSTDGLEAYVTIRSAPNTAVPEQEIKDAIASEGVVYGTLEDKIKELSTKKGVRGHPVLVAEGKKAEPGVNAKIEYFFETSPRPKLKMSKDGKVNYKESTVIPLVKDGQLLAVKSNAERGASGKSVKGRELRGKMGRDTSLRRGSGTEFEDETKYRLIASHSGCVHLRKDNEVEVTGEYSVKGDVDYKSGNIRFDGDVIVYGNVRSGFSIHATKNIEIKGVVEDAYIHCGGNLLIRGGFVGSGKGVCEVVGETHIRFLENQKVYCNSNVYVAEEIIHSEVVSGNKVYVKYGKGAIIGGNIVAKEGIEAKTLGNVHYLKTKLTVAKDPVIDNILYKIEEIEEGENVTREKIQLAINKYVQRKYTKGDLEKEEEDHLNHLYYVMGNYDKWLKELKNRHDQMERERKVMVDNAYIHADTKVYPGVIMQVDVLPKQIDQEYDRMGFKIVDGVLQEHRFVK